MFGYILRFFRNSKSLKDADLQRFARNEFKKDAEYAYYWMKKNKTIFMSYGDIRNV
jgi:hypothetical protein